ncbi:MAG TPA: ion transporter [Gaiellaceae bacterium]|nr:ion transporter [Gaiellaceae bacterium]
MADPPSREEALLEGWLETATERSDPFMAWLGVVFALLVGYELAVEPSGARATVVLVAGWAIWAVFALEFLARLRLAPAKLRFLRRNWLQALGLLIPTLRVLRFVRLLRLRRALPAARAISASYRTLGSARRVARSRLSYLAAVTAAVVVAVAEVAYVFERDEPDGIFASFGEALFWAASAVLGQQADPVPQSAGARAAMLAGFVMGLTVVALLAATLGAWFVGSEREIVRRRRTG